MLKNLIPKVFYNDIQEGIELFVHGLRFKILYQDEDLTVVARDGAKAYIVQNSELAAKDRPELSIETDDIDTLYKEISERAPNLLHPNSNVVSLKPWGAREFAVLDPTQVCIVFREWT